MDSTSHACSDVVEKVQAYVHEVTNDGSETVGHTWRCASFPSVWWLELDLWLHQGGTTPYAQTKPCRYLIQLVWVVVGRALFGAVFPRCQSRPIEARDIEELSRSSLW